MLKSAITLNLLWASALSNPISKGDKIMKNTSLNCWQNSYCLYHSWKRLLGRAVGSLLLIGWLNRGLLASDRLDWLHSSSSRSPDSELSERQGEKERERGERKTGRRPRTFHSIAMWLLVPISLLPGFLSRQLTEMPFLLQEAVSSQPQQAIKDFTLE